MSAPAPKTPRPEPRPSSDRAIGDSPEAAIGLQVITRLSAAVRLARAYSTDNQVFGQQVELLLEAIHPLLEQSGEAVLAAIDNDLYLNGTRIPVRGRNLRFHQNVLEDLKRRQIAGFQARRGVTTDEMMAFFRVYMQPDFFTGPEMLQECVAQGAERMQPVVHASNVPMGGISYGASPAPDDADDDGGRFDGPDAAEFEGSDSLEGGGGRRGPRGSVRKTYSAAVAGARSLLMTTSLQGGTELRHAKRVVQPLVDGAFAQEPVVVGLASLSHHDQYTYAHAVNVTLVAVTMGHFLELDRRALADLGVASLLHDVGKSAVGSRIEHLLESFTPEEELLAERHPVEGVKLLARSTTLNATTFRCMRVALEHHAGPEEGGYPSLGPEWRTSMLSRIVSTADCFVSLQMHRSMRGAHVTPYEALGMMLGPLKGRFHPAMLWALVQTVGFYPPGQLVELEDGAIAVVLAPNARDLARPHVRLLVAPDGRRYAGGEAVELKPLPPERSVKRALRGAEYPRDEAEAA